MKFKVGDREALLSKKDVELFNSRSWHIRTSGKATPYLKSGKGTYFHRQVMERSLQRKLFSNEIVDHIDRNPFNNQRSNLRLTTKSLNALNTDGHRDRKGPFKGVRWHSKTKKYGARFMVDGKEVSCGYFDCPKEAFQARETKLNAYLIGKR